MVIYLRFEGAINKKSGCRFLVDKIIKKYTIRIKIEL
jgi:hypothetical protein